MANRLLKYSKYCHYGNYTAVGNYIDARPLRKRKRTGTGQVRELKVDVPTWLGVEISWTLMQVGVVKPCMRICRLHASRLGFCLGESCCMLSVVLFV